MNVDFHCICGASYTGALPNSPKGKQVLAVLIDTHKGKGHAATDARGARRARYAEAAPTATATDGGATDE